MNKRILPLLVLSFIYSFLSAQVTTSSISGTVVDKNGQALSGATVTAVHLPSGTTYSALSGKEGVFNLPNLRIGGPYQFRVNYVGLQPYSLDSFFLQLGEPFNVNAMMGENVQALETVVVTSTGRRAAADRIGTGTNIGSRQITTLPTITRSITDFTRLTPQASGTSFAGRDARYNNIQIDGANLNNNFGLSNDPLPGGGNPISLDAIEEISVNIAPFDVRQANFTGAGISAVTRSGDNIFKGSAYGFYRDQSFNGRNVGNIRLPESQKSTNKIYGARLGGPIIKDKLFFFINAEREKREFPGIPFRPSQPGLPPGGNVSATPIDSLRKLSEYLQANYKYNPGAYDNFPSFQAENRKLLGRIDWNLSKAHKVILKYSDFLSTNDVQLNATSVPGGGFGAVSRMGNSRFGNNSMAFENSNYGFKDIVKSGTAELNSRFSNKFANQFLATYTKIKTTRTFKGGVFPTIDFLNLAPSAPINNQNYMQVGMDPFTYNNDVINNIYSFIDNFTYFAGKHTITAGGSYEHQRVGNMFMPASNSYYIFRSLNDFITNQPPVYFAYTYSLVKGQPAVYSAELKIAQLGLYLQDEYSVSNKLKITAGLRIDRPIYDEQPIANPAVEKLTFLDENGSSTRYTTGRWPKSTWYWSPRVGFRWDPEGNKSLIIRGGSGLFTGRIPFVFLTNIPTNSAMYQVTATVSATDQLQNYKFNPDPNAYASTFPQTAGTTIVNNANFVFTNPKFKFPQIFRSNLAIDKSFGKGYMLTLEAILTKDINAVYMRNANLRNPDTVLAGPNDRPRWKTSPRLNSNIGSAIVLENTNKGGAFSFTTQLSKSFTQGFYGSVAYTYTLATDVSANPGSTATSVWNSNPNRRTANTVELGYSQYALPHRIVGTLSYRKEYLRHLATTVSLFYEGSQDTYSYTYSADINNDGNGFDLIYIPRSSNEIVFTTATINGVTYTPAQQWEIFNQYIEQDKYLRKHRGQVAERYAARYPFYHRVDAKILQDIFSNIGNHRHSLQFSADILNLPNLLSRNWGIRQTTVQRNILVPTGFTTGGAPTYRINSANNAPVTSTYQNVVSTTSTWGLQLGLRYIF
ncbi:MAG: carboxypeptidase regulatory-like domain-containing protein [Bacteroidota bacterium]|nr:carboxypeptidase regulatory-like domain-containing protein [Bacteroidota bacterium]